MSRRLLFLLVFSILSVAIIALLYLVVERMSPSQIRQVTGGLGVRKPEVIGFQPYWLVGSGEHDYSRSISTLTYFGLALHSDGTVKKEDAPGETEPGWLTLNSERYQATLSAHRKAGTTLSLLVHLMNEEDILQLVATPEAHARNLVQDVAPIMQNHGFRDLNLDIESFTEASESTRQNYVRFVRAVKDELDRLQLGTLTVELTPKSAIAHHFIDVARIGEIADFLVLMAYDFHYVYSSLAGPVAPVGGVPTVAEFDVETALRETLRYAPAEKVILGVPLYGYEWETLRSDPGAPVIPGSWQLATGKRVVPFSRTCTDCTSGFDSVSREPYLIFPGERPGHFQQAFYENKEALEAKIALANVYHLAGVAMWALGYESEGTIDPISVYKNTVQFKGFGTAPIVEYTKVQPATFTMMPPTHALVGSISTMSGTVMKLGRQDKEYREARSDESVVQGESLSVGVDSAVRVRFPDSIELTMQEGSEIAFSGLLAPGLFVRQSGGTVDYSLKNGGVPWSIRVHHTLIQLSGGDIRVVMDGDRATVTVLRGTVLIGAIDTDNVTSAYQIKQGGQAVILLNNRSVRVAY